MVDHFHLVKLGNDALTKVRCRVTWVCGTAVAAKVITAGLKKHMVGISAQAKELRERLTGNYGVVVFVYLIAFSLVRVQCLYNCWGSRVRVG